MLLPLPLNHFSHVRLFATPWTAAYQAPPSVGFSRQEYWSGVPLPSPLNDHAPAAAAKSLQSCPTLCDPIDGSPPGSPIPGILQARILEWVAISFSNAWKWKVKVKSFSRVWLFATPRTAAYQAPPSMGFSRQEYWSGLPLPSPLNDHSVQFSHSDMSDSLQPRESQHARPPCPSPTPGVYSNSCPLSRWCHPTISTSVVPFSSCSQSLPAAGSFSTSQLFAWGSQ